MIDPQIAKDIGIDDAALVDIMMSTTTRISTRLEKTGWSEKICLEYAKSSKIPEGLRSLASQVEVCLKFLQFYATGSVPNTHTELDVVLAMATIIYKDRATKPADLIWPDDYYAAEDQACGFSLIGQTDLVPEKNITGGEKTETGKAEAEAELLKTIGLNTEVDDLTENLGIMFETVDNRARRLQAAGASRPEANINTLASMAAPFLHGFKNGTLEAFLAECAKLFKTHPAKNGFNEILLQAIRLLNALAITMLRKCIKTSAQMMTVFRKEQYRNNLQSLVPGELSNNYAPPSNSCINALIISKKNKNTRSLIAKIIILRVKEEETNPKMVAVLFTTVLTHTAWNGMGILHLLFEICDYHSVSWITIMKKTMLSTTASTWKEINLFMKDYQQKEREDRTVPWARVIDDSYFNNLTTYRHFHLAALLIESLIQSQGHDGILQSKWAMDHKHTVERYREASILLHNKLSGTLGNVVAGSQAATTSAEIINPRKAEEENPVFDGFGCFDDV